MIVRYAGGRLPYSPWLVSGALDDGAGPGRKRFGNRIYVIDPEGSEEVRSRRF
jgi:hypothetical protein